MNGSGKTILYRMSTPRQLATNKLKKEIFCQLQISEFFIMPIVENA